MPITNSWPANGADPWGEATQQWTNDVESSVADLEELTTEGRLSDDQLSAAYAANVPMVDALAAYGDSFTASNHDDATPWPEQIGDDLGIEYVNEGEGGKCSSDIAIRQGGLLLLVTVSGGSLPTYANGAPTPIIVTPETAWKTGQDAWYQGTLLGHGVQVKHRGFDNTWELIRLASGAAVPIPSGTPFIINEAADRRGDWQTISGGRNNLASIGDGSAGTALAIAIRDIDLMVQHLVAVGNHRYQVFPIPSIPSETPITTTGALLARRNADLAARFGPKFCDWQSWTAQNGLALIGVTPTLTDVRDMNAGVIPTTLRADADGHLTSEGYDVLADFVREHAIALGYITGKTRLQPPSRAASVNPSASGSTAFNITWSAVTGATSYEVQFKPWWSSKWMLAGYTTGTSLTLSGLRPSMLYNVRHRAWNAAGPGPWGLVATNEPGGTEATLLLSDRFATDLYTLDGVAVANDLRGGTLTVNWEASGIGVSGRRVASNPPNANRCLLVDSSSADGVVYFQVTELPSSNELAIVGRYTSDTECYSVVINVQGVANVYKGIDSGSRTGITTSGNYAVKAGDVVALGLSGTSISLWVNERLISSATSSLVTSGTKWGARIPVAADCSLAEFALTT